MKKKMIFFIFLSTLLTFLLNQDAISSKTISPKHIAVNPPSVPHWNSTIHMGSVGKKNTKVFIYCTHCQESYRNTSGKKQNTNIHNVGNRLMNQLEARGIGTILVIRQCTHKRAYAKSRVLIRSVINKNPHITYLIDIHRDSLTRGATTKYYHKKSFARIVFVVGKSGKNFKNNLKLARHLHAHINKRYPQLSKNINIKKRTAQINGEYNQSLSSHNLLIEVGGKGNTLTEAYRTIDVIARILSSKIKAEESVN